jgi:hypothetical protein
MTTKQLNQAAVGDTIVTFGSTTFTAAVRVIEVCSTSFGPHLIKVFCEATGQHSAYPCAGLLGSKRITVA